MIYFKLFLVVVAGLSATPHVRSNFQCARYCKEDSDNFGYEINKSYVYSYSGVLRTLINSTSAHLDESKVMIESEVVFQHLSRCDYLMQVTNITIRDNQIAKSVQEAKENKQRYIQVERRLKEHPIRFSFNGKIETLCPDERELKEVTDIKRGILTLFQNSNPHFKSNALVYETDVTGSCETVFKVSHLGSTKFLEKFKDLSSCDHRLSQYLSWQSVPYATTSKVKSLSLLKSFLNCQLEYAPNRQGRDILQEATCFERHAFQPFSNGDSGAVTIGQQNLKLLSVTQRTDEVPLKSSHNIQRASLLYEYVQDKEEALKDTRMALKILGEIEAKTSDGVDVEAPHLFTNLVQEFQGLSKAQLLGIFNKTNTNQRKFFIDVISSIRTTSGIEIMVHLYQEKQLTSKQMNSWLVSLNFLKTPRKKTLQVIYPLNFHAELKKNALLALSSILYKYCSKQSNCLDDVVVFEIVKNIELPLLNNCRQTSTQTANDIQLALKCIGNAGIVTSYYNLQSCYMNEDLPVYLRLAGLAAHRRMNCAENENLDDFMSILADAKSNSEIRIAAYLASMQCASYSTFAQVKDVLLKEEANQVGSFIWTHLTNLQETSVPWKQSIRKLIENEFLKNKFNTDVRKYSRNYEASTFVDTLGAGGGVEANVIFTPESYLPRSAMLNFTVDLFGQSLNVLELGTRMEGFEDIVEKLFGPNGYFASASTAAESAEVAEGRRGKAHMGQLNDKFQMLPSEPSGSFYAKIFGNEISYVQFNDLNDLLGVPSSGKEAFNMLVNFVSMNGVEYTKSLSFLDASFRLPTILGFPLQLKASGSATVGLTAGGEIQVQDLRRNKILVRGKVYPSAAVQVKATMSVDTYAGEAGVQYVGTMNTNTYIDGYANLELGKVIEVKINVPKKQMDIFAVTSNVYLIQNDRTTPIRDLSPNVETSEYCTDSYIAKTIGMQWCNHWRYVNASSAENTPNFPLTGTFRYSCHVRKADVFDYFHLYAETQLQSTPPAKPYLIHFLLDTPGSNVDRKIQAMINVDVNTYRLDANVYTPMGTFTIQSNVEKSAHPPKYHFQLLTTLNNKEIVTLHSTFDVKDEGAMVTYEPAAKLNYKQQQIVALSGKLSHAKGGDYSADLKLEGAMNGFAQIYGSFNCSSEHFNIKTNFLSNSLKGRMDAEFRIKPNIILLLSSTNYSYNTQPSQSIDFRGQYSKNNIIASRNMSSNSLSVLLKSTEFPQYNTEVAWVNQRASMYFNNTVKLKLFETTWNTHQIVKLDDNFSDNDASIIILGDLQCPEKNIHYRAEASYSRSSQHLKTRGVLQLSPVQRYEVLFDLQSQDNIDHAFLLTYYPKSELTLTGTITKKAKNYEFNFSCRHKSPLKEYTLVTLIGDYQNSSLGEMQNHKVNCTLDMPTLNEELKSPWHIMGNLQQSQTMFLSYSRIMTTETEFLAHLNWMEENLALSVHANDKPLFIINGARNEEMLNFGLALNIYQYIELSAKLVHPYQSFDLQFYWDKDRDESKRFLIGIRRNAFLGEYTMNIEYPNQRILTNVILVPTQVTMNVTWGIQISQQIYLKLGNKVYDSGGLWFGELETPFRYLEKQQFSLKYYVDNNSFDVQFDLSWRNHIIHLLLVGSRTESRLAMTMQLNTTLPELRFVGADLTHSSEHLPMVRSHNTALRLDYNEYSISATSALRIIADKVDADFRIDSKSDAIEPVYAQLVLNDESRKDANKIHAILCWHNKNITALYNFNSETASITLLTPFEGLRKSIIQYIVITNGESVHIEAMMDVLQQNNSISLDWANTIEEIALTLSFTSPITGRYHLVFSHGRLLFELNENVLIQGPNDRDILCVTIMGNIVKGNLGAALVLLDQEAKLDLRKVSTSPEDVQWNATAQMNDMKMNALLELHYVDGNLDMFNLSMISDSFSHLKMYLNKNPGYSQSTIFGAEYSGVFLLQNNLTHVSKSLFENSLVMKMPNMSLQINHSHFFGTQLDQLVSVVLNEGAYEFGYNFTGRKSDSEVALQLEYNFKQNSYTTHSIVLSSKIQQTVEKELFIINVHSEDMPLNGKIHIEHFKNEGSHQLLIGNVHVGSYLKLDIDATRNYTHIIDHLTGRSIQADYKWMPNEIAIHLVSSYESIRNTSFALEWAQNSSTNILFHWDAIILTGQFSETEVSMLLNQNDTELVEFELIIAGISDIQLDLNMFQSLKVRLDYNITAEQILALNCILNTTLEDFNFQTKYSNRKMETTISINGKEYSGYVDHNCQYGGTFQLIHPENRYDGGICIESLSFNATLSSSTSKNWFAASILAMTMRSDYLQIPETIGQMKLLNDSDFEGFFVVHRNTSVLQYNFMGGYHLPTYWIKVNGPHEELLLDANITMQAESLEDIDISLHIKTSDKKFKFELRNSFGEDYKTAMEVITPFDGWSRISFDCNVNNDSLGISVLAKNRQFLIMARRTGSNLLIVEYHGETLLEITASEGVITLRTTNKLGKYRMLVQSTTKPGIYMFSILCEGENFVSFMLQNYSRGDVMHFKGKLMAPGIIPDNSTMAIELQTQIDIWKLLSFRLKKDQRPLIELGWEAKLHEFGFDAMINFYSEFEQVRRFWIAPKVDLRSYVDIKYLCATQTECLFKVAIMDKHIECISQSPINTLNFHVFADYVYRSPVMEANFYFNDSKNIQLSFNFLAHDFSSIFYNHTGILKTDLKLIQNSSETAVTNEFRVYILGELNKQDAKVDIQCPVGAFSFAIRGNRTKTWGTSSITIGKLSKNYIASWTTIETKEAQKLTVSLKENFAQIGKVTYTNILERGPDFIKSEISLHGSYRDDKLDTVLSGALTKDSAKIVFSIFTPFKQFPSVKSLSDLKLNPHSTLVEQYLTTPSNEYSMHAQGTYEQVDILCKHSGQTFNETIKSLLTRDRYSVSMWPEFRFSLQLGTNSDYMVDAYETPTRGYSIQANSKDGKSAVILNFEANSIHLQLKSIGGVESAFVEMNSDRFMVATWMFDYVHVTYADITPRIAFGCLVTPVDASQHPTEELVGVLYKNAESKLPDVHFLQGLYKKYHLNRANESILVIKSLQQRIRAEIGYKMNAFDHSVIELEALGQFVSASVSWVANAYVIVLESSLIDSGVLAVNQDFTSIRNNIYMPFVADFKNNTLTFISENYNLTTSLKKNQIQVKQGDLQVNLTYIQDEHLNLKFLYGDDYKLVIRKDFLDVDMKELYLNVDLSAKQFLAKLKYDTLACHINALSYRNGLFKLQKSNILLCEFQYSYDRNSFKYYSDIPQLDFLRLIDIYYNWRNSATLKQFLGHINIESEYAGSIRSNGSFILKQHLLDVVVSIHAPFLAGHESVYGKVYIPSHFRPHIDVILPNQRYKLLFDHDGTMNQMQTELVYINQKIFTLRADINSYQRMNKLNITFPDERFHTFWITTNATALEGAFNEDYYGIVSMSDQYFLLKTPIQGFSKIAYRFINKLKKNRLETGILLEHPLYDQPLGVHLQVNHSQNALDLVYFIHLPFEIHIWNTDKNFMELKTSIRVIPDQRVDARILLVSNGINSGAAIGFNLAFRREVQLKLRAHWNRIHFITELEFKSTSASIVIVPGVPLSSSDLALINLHPSYEGYVSASGVLIFYMLLENDRQALLVNQKEWAFAIRREGQQFFKIIWDLRKCNETALGYHITDNEIELITFGNIIKGQLDSNSETIAITLMINNASIVYNSQDTSKHLGTPFGHVYVFNQKFSTTDGIPTNLPKPYLIIGRRDLQPRLYELYLRSSAMPGECPIMLILDLTHFASLASIIDARLSYSSDPDKTVHFRMTYNASNANGLATTERIFMLKHLASKIDYELYFKANRMPDFSNGSIVLSYHDFDVHRDERIKASVKVDHLHFGVTAEVLTSKNRLSLMATSTTGLKRHGFQTTIELNDKDPLNLECTYNFRQENPSLSLMAAHGSSRRFVFYAGLPNEREMVAKLGHDHYGRASVDAFATVRLNTSQLLWMKVLWKENMFAPLQEAIFDEYTDLRYVVEAVGQQMIDVMHDDVGKVLIEDVAHLKQYAINETLKDLATMSSTLQRILKCNDAPKVSQRSPQAAQMACVLRSNLQELFNSFGMAVAGNLYSLQSLCAVANAEMRSSIHSIRSVHSVKLDAVAILKKGISSGRRSLKEMEAIAVQLLDDVDHWVSNAKENIETFFEPFLSLIDDFIAYVEQRLTMLQVAVLDMMNSVQQYIFDLREIKAVYSVYYSYVNWLEELHVVDILEPIGDVIEEMLDTIIKDVKQVLDHYKPYLDALGDVLMGKYESVRQLPPVAELRDHVNRIYHKTVWLWHYHNMSEELKSAVRKVSTDVDRVLALVALDDLPHEDFDYSFGYTYVIRPENRLIEISQPLPVEWDAFNKSPSFEHYPLYQRIQGKSQQFVKFYKSRYDLIDMLETFVADLYEPSIAPPTFNNAMIIGRSQYSTFNGVSYNFVSNCSYLLATDFKTKSFSLIVNYHGNGSDHCRSQKSYEIITNDNVFEIFNHDRVTLNGQAVDLPIIHRQVVITREHENIVAESSRGFKMVCHFHYEFCTVQLSGWLFGRTAGLLGTLDNEQFTDISSSRGPTRNISEFLDSWKVGDATCNVVEAPDFTTEVHAMDYGAQLCRLLFNDRQSPLKKCFDEIDPNPFEEMCLNEIKANPELKVCAPTAAYVHRCRKAKIAIQMPELCVTCKDDIGYTEEIFDGHNNKTIDVVFLTELDCPNLKEPKAMAMELPTLLDEHLNLHGFSANRFAAVGYGGTSLPKPHLNTFGGRIWSASTGFYMKTHLPGGTQRKSAKFTAIDAIKYAATLEFRVGVPKLFILTQCEVATDVSNSPDIYNMLGEKDITLHVLKPAPFGRPADGLVGITMFTSVMEEDSVNQTKRAEIIGAIDDVYSGLALSTNGSIFDVNQVLATHLDATRWADKVAANAQRSPCQKCICVQDSNGVGKIECSRCFSPAVKQFLHVYEDRLKMIFNDNEAEI